MCLSLRRALELCCRHRRNMLRGTMETRYGDLLNMLRASPKALRGPPETLRRPLIDRLRRSLKYATSSPANTLKGPTRDAAGNLHNRCWYPQTRCGRSPNALGIPPKHAAGTLKILPSKYAVRTSKSAAGSPKTPSDYQNKEKNARTHSNQQKINIFNLTWRAPRVLSRPVASTP